MPSGVLEDIIPTGNGGTVVWLLFHSGCLIEAVTASCTRCVCTIIFYLKEQAFSVLFSFHSTCKNALGHVTMELILRTHVEYLGHLIPT